MCEREKLFIFNRKQRPNLCMMYFIQKLFIQNNLPNMKINVIYIYIYIYIYIQIQDLNIE